MSTRAQILAKIAAQFPDNTAGLITPAKLRQVVGDVTNSCLVSETDAGTSGRAVLQAVTPAQVRAAAGFGGTVTVAQLNAAGADARSAMYYCSDCLTVNGPGSLVAWCGRTMTWRTLDDCLLATTDFTAWANDFCVNSNSSEIRGRFGALFRGFENSVGVTFSNGGGATSVVTPYGPPFRRRMTSATSATNYVRALGVTFGSVAANAIRVFCGVTGFKPGATAGVAVRVGLTTVNNPSNVTLTASENSICLDAANVLGGLNASLSTNYLACIRNGSTNLTGSGVTGVASSTSTEANLLVVSDLGEVAMFVNGTLAASGQSTPTTARYPFMICGNNGISAASVDFDISNFCCGYYMPTPV